MQVNRHFDSYLSNVSLNDTRLYQAQAAHESLQDFLQNDGPVARYLCETFVQGSYAQGTIIRPRHEVEEFDVDVVVSLNVGAMSEDRRSVPRLVEWLKNRIATSDKYRGKVRHKNRCIRITFSGMFHLDVVATYSDTRSGNATWVPDSNLGEWVKSHPKGFTKWINSQSGGLRKFKLKNVAKMIKNWRNEKVGRDSAPRSIVLQTLIGHYMPTVTDSDAHAVTATFEALNSALAEFRLVPNVPNPVVPDENLARHWTQEGFDQFKNHLARAAARSRRALEHRDQEMSVRLWREIFGDRFPS